MISELLIVIANAFCRDVHEMSTHCCESINGFWYITRFTCCWTWKTMTPDLMCTVAMANFAPWCVYVGWYVGTMCMECWIGRELEPGWWYNIISMPTSSCMYVSYKCCFKLCKILNICMSIISHFCEVNINMKLKVTNITTACYGILCWQRELVIGLSLRWWKHNFCLMLCWCNDVYICALKLLSLDVCETAVTVVFVQFEIM